MASVRFMTWLVFVGSAEPEEEELGEEAGEEEEGVDKDKEKDKEEESSS